jgi:hypothetical protein
MGQLGKGRQKDYHLARNTGRQNQWDVPKMEFLAVPQYGRPTTTGSGIPSRAQAARCAATQAAFLHVAHPLQFADGPADRVPEDGASLAHLKFLGVHGGSG